MHPPRLDGIKEGLALADRLAEWLLSHCPMTTLTLLTMLVGSTIGVPRPWQIFAAVVVADVAINVVRRRRRAKRPHVGAIQPRVTA